MAISFHELSTAFRSLGIERGRPVLAHASLSAFGEVRGGAEALASALLAAFNPLVMPAFTYQTMIIPETGPDFNGIRYGSGSNLNRMAEFFSPGMPVDRMIGAVAEALRRHPQARRSGHPILSFVGVGAADILEAQTLADPLAPIRVMAEKEGWVILLGVNQTVNTAIHYAEQLAGRRQFTRWALTPEGIVECQGFPGCSDGFDQLAPHLEGISRLVQAGAAAVQAIPLVALLDRVQALLDANPQALLCDRKQCDRCDAVRGRG
jgi:aminoglycoside 3-N-acetyltransferase